MTQAFPLQWPQGWPRTPADQKKPGRFNTKGIHVSAYSNERYTVAQDLTIADAVKRVIGELDKLIGAAGGDVVISTNLRTRRDGLPYSEQGEPMDAGAAVYWRDGRHMRVMAIDRYQRVADNLAAIAATLEAMRAIDRHGGAQILERAFTGFDALPAPGREDFDPWQVLGLARGTLGLNPKVVIEQRFRDLARKAHPDTGGTTAAFQRLERARREALAQVGVAQ